MGVKSLRREEVLCLGRGTASGRCRMPESGGRLGKISWSQDKKLQINEIVRLSHWEDCVIEFLLMIRIA